MSEELNKVDLVCDSLFPALDAREPINLDQGMSHEPTAEFLLKAEDEQSLSKNGGVDPSWNEEIGVAPRVELSPEFLKRSDERMERVKETLWKFFRNHPGEFAEAIALAKQARKDVREEFAA